VIADEGEFRNYLTHALDVLKPGGVLFGSTLGQMKEDVVGRSLEEWEPPRVMTREHLTGNLTDAGFTTPQIVQLHHVPSYIADNRCVFQFCTKKPA